MTMLREPLLIMSANHLRPAEEVEGLGRALAWNPLLLITGGFGFLADGGRLLVWPDGVSFEPHSANLPGGAWAAPATAIRSVSGFAQRMAKGLELELQDGSRRRFVVAGRDARLEELRRLGMPVR